MISKMQRDGWVPGVTLAANDTLFFADVDNDERISDRYPKWKDSTDMYTILSATLIGITTALVIASSLFDFWTDKLFRTAARMEEYRIFELTNKRSDFELS